MAEKSRRSTTHTNRIWDYIWLVFVPYSLTDYLPPKTLSDYGWLTAIGVFVLAYVSANESKRWRAPAIVLEVGITFVFALWQQNFYLMIFPAWQLPYMFSYYPQRKLYPFFGLYYGVLAAALFVAWLKYPREVMSPWVWMGLFFPLISPWFSNYMARSSMQDRAMAQTNRRLEAVVRRGERERIARDLHDTLGQSFSMITIKTQLAEKLLEKKPDQVAAELKDIEATSRANLQLVRQIVNDLHQQSISDVLLAQEENLAAASIHLDTEDEEDANSWPTAIQNTISAVLQECVTNVIRHSHAHALAITFNKTAAAYTVQIQDDGVGSAAYTRQGANGVSGMAQRIQDLGGTFTIAANRIGTIVTCTIPKEGPDT